MATGNARGGRADTFDSGQFGTLRYDFKAYGGVQGMIPDPSDEMIEQYLRGMRDAAKEFSAAENTEDLSAEQLQELLEDDQNMRLAEAQQVIAGLTAELCGGSPTKEQLLALPFRVRQAFLSWLQGKLVNPESNAAGSTPSRVARIGG